MPKTYRVSPRVAIAAIALTAFASLLPGVVSPASRALAAPAPQQSLAAPSTFTPLLTSREAAAVDAAVQKEMAAQGGLVGVAIGVIEKGQIVYLQGYGYADRDAKIPVSAEATRFRWASISKCLTAIAALQLAEAGRLDLDADVRRYVPEFPDKKVVITPRQLLCHQGGIVHYVNGPVVRTPRPNNDPQAFADVVTALDTFKDSPLVAAPGERYSYSTHGFILLSAVVQRAGEERFADQVRRRIAAPLSMTTLQPDYHWVNIPGRAAGYRRDKAGVIVPSADVDVSWKLGGGGYVSTAADMARFAQGLINHQLVKPETERAMWTAQKTKDGTATGYGLGFQVEQRPNNVLRVYHGGSQDGSKTWLTTYPLQRHGVVVLCNSEWADPGKIATAIYAALNAARNGK